MKNIINKKYMAIAVLFATNFIAGQDQSISKGTYRVDFRNPALPNTPISKPTLTIHKPS